jgi:hypothetical protein
VKFVSGSDALRGVAARIAKAKIPAEFPDDAPAKLVRRGVLMGGQFVLFVPADVRSVE